MRKQKREFGAVTFDGCAAMPGNDRDERPPIATNEVRDDSKGPVQCATTYKTQHWMAARSSENMSSVSIFIT